MDLTTGQTRKQQAGESEIETIIYLIWADIGVMHLPCAANSSNFKAIGNPVVLSSSNTRILFPDVLMRNNDINAL